MAVDWLNWENNNALIPKSEKKPVKYAFSMIVYEVA